LLLLVKDFHDLVECIGKEDATAKQIRDFRAKHLSKRTLIQHLDKAGPH
jgi:hypothetical protein